MIMMRIGPRFKGITPIKFIEDGESGNNWSVIFTLKLKIQVSGRLNIF